jgi:hypothetical protein
MSISSLRFAGVIGEDSGYTSTRSIPPLFARAT